MMQEPQDTTAVAQPADAGDQPSPTAAEPVPEQTPSVFTRYNQNEQTYELVAEVDGVPVVFATVKAGLVQSATGQARAAQETE